MIMNGIPFSILIVDDDEDDRWLIDEAFKQIDYEAEVKKFINGESLLHYLGQLEKSLYPTLIVLDNTLPTMDATDILSMLKKDPKYQNIRVVVYTSSVSPQKRDFLLNMGAHACIEKGPLMDDVVKVARQLRDLSESSIEP